MKRAALATILCVLFSAATYAQHTPADAPASKEDINRLLDVMHSRDMMTTVMNMMSKQIGSMVHQQVNQNHDLPPDAEARINKMVQDMYKNFPVDDLIQATDPRLSNGILRRAILTRLSRSTPRPRVQRFLQEMPAITQESMQASMGIAQKMVAKMQQQIQDQINQMQQEKKQGPQ